jgi:type 1 glutamine amidotransferase
MNRRSFLRQASLVSLSTFCLDRAARAAASAAGGKARKILFFTKSSGFEHSVISWKKEKPGWAEKVLLPMGEQNHWEFTFSKDGSLFSKDYLAQFDAYFFYTTGNLCERGTDGEPPMTEAGKQALFDAVAAGKGFVGTHSASDTFHTANEKDKGPDRYKNHGAQADPYVRFLGGEFIKHNKQQSARMRCVDPKFPGFGKVKDGFELTEEWYSLKDFSDDLHVILVQETKGMEGPDYQRPPYPATWARKHGQGRVFYTSMGHREDVWTNPMFQEMLTGGLMWALGDVQAEIPPNIKEVTPEANQLQPFYQEPPKAPKK